MHDSDGDKEIIAPEDEISEEVDPSDFGALDKMLKQSGRLNASDL